MTKQMNRAKWTRSKQWKQAKTRFNGGRTKGASLPFKRIAKASSAVIGFEYRALAQG